MGFWKLVSKLKITLKSTIRQREPLQNSSLYQQANNHQWNCKHHPASESQSLFIIRLFQQHQICRRANCRTNRKQMVGISYFTVVHFDKN